MLENFSLKDRNTFRLDCFARYFCDVGNNTELISALKFARKNKLKIFILGSGSNILFKDRVFEGLVISLAKKDTQWKDDGEVVHADVSAGKNWDEFVLDAVSRGLSGIENLSLIPGTVGAAPVQNIGAYGAEVKDCVVSVTVVNKETLKEEILSNIECQFGYRESIFKNPRNSLGKKYIITSVLFQFKKHGVPSVAYPDVKKYFEEYSIKEINPKNVREAVIDIRTKKLPSILEYGTVGSFWKNPAVSKEIAQELVKKYPDLPTFPAQQGVKISLAWVLDKVCGLKGFREGDIGLYKNQPLVVVTFGDVTAKEILLFAQKVEQIVKEKTGISIEKEVEIIA